MNSPHRILLVPALVVVLSASAALYGQRQPLGTEEQPRPKWRQRTAHVLAGMSEAQRFRGLHFQNFRTTTRVLDRQQSVGIRTAVFAGSPASAAQVFAGIACNSAATFVGTVISHSSHPIADGTFLFTDYVIRLEEPIRMPTGKFKAGDEVILSRPGGVLMVDGVRTEAISDNFPRLTAASSYALFTSYIPATESFISRDDWGTFSLIGDAVVAHKRLPISDVDPELRGMSREQFRQQLRTSWGNCRKETRP